MPLFSAAPRAVAIALPGALLAILMLLAASSQAGAGGGGLPPSGNVVVFLRSDAIPADSAPSVRAAAVSASEDAVLAGAGEGVAVTYRYRAIAGFAANVSAAAAERLANDPRVVMISPDFEGHGADSESFALVRANEAHSLGYDGAGVVVGVIDSGVNESHPDLAPAIIHEECFMAAVGLASRCPNGSTRESGAGSAHDDLGHGTNVSGIIAGRGSQSPIGMAPAAMLEEWKVIDSQNAFYFSDLAAAIDDIVSNHPEVRVLNLSLGTFDDEPASSCTTDPMFDQLSDAGILVFASAMNQTYKNGMGYPACVDSVVSVGAVYDQNAGSYTYNCTDAPVILDHVPCWSNSDSTLDLLAPGCSITSTGLSENESTYCGTSQAAPHAAGAAALLMQEHPSGSLDDIERVLESSGDPVTDPANGVTTPRLDVLSAVTAPLTPPTPSPGPTATEIPCTAPDACSVSGDANCDGHVNFDDALAVLLSVDGTQPAACPRNADANCDGAVDPPDALLIFRARAGFSPPLPLGCRPIG